MYSGQTASPWVLWASAASIHRVILRGESIDKDRLATENEKFLSVPYWYVLVTDQSAIPVEALTPTVEFQMYLAAKSHHSLPPSKLLSEMYTWCVVFFPGWYNCGQGFFSSGRKGTNYPASWLTSMHGCQWIRWHSHQPLHTKTTKLNVFRCQNIVMIWHFSAF